MSSDARIFPQVYLNGTVLPLEQATIPVLDRGFLFGDAIYEVLPVYGGRPFHPETHLARLADGLAAIGIHSRHEATDWLQIIDQVITANGNGDMSIYLQVTRGVGTYRDHASTETFVPLIFAMAQKLARRPVHIATHGINAILLEDSRWARCNIKATSLLANVLLRQEAVRHSATEAILHDQGMITEGAASTIMIVTEGVLNVAPNSPQILPGTTRSLVLELADAEGIAVVKRRFSVDELRSADEVLLSAATKELLPVCRLGEQAIGDGTPGPVWQQLDAAFQRHKHDWLRAGAAPGALQTAEPSA